MSNPQRLPNPDVIEWNDSLTGDFLWSNVNFGEAVTQTMTPLTWSVIQFTLDDWIFLPGFSMVGNIGGIPYLNISIFASVFHALGRSRQDLLKAMESTLYMRLPAEMEIPLIPLSQWALLSGLLASVKVQLKQWRGVQKLSSYLLANPAWFGQMRERVRAANKSGLISLWRGEIRPHIKQGVWCVLGSVTHSTDYTLRLRQDLTELVGPDDANILIANLSDSSGRLASLDPMIGLEKVARGEMSREVYLAQYGHRGPHEFEVSVPRPAENPEWLDDELNNLRILPSNVTALMAAQRETFAAAWERLQSRFPHKANAIQRRMAESARRARLREVARSEYTRDRWLIRLFALRAAELTGLGEDVFSLTLDEVLNLLAGDRTAIGAIPARRDAYVRYKSLPSYPSVIRGQFDPFQWAANPNRRSDIFDSRAAFRAMAYQPDRSNIVKGSPGSAGRVEGIARVVASPEEGYALQRGEVLVAVQTDIAWTLLFPRVSAVVTDVGAPLSHAAIVARELGIPAVVGCGNATQRLKTGDRVRVDGAKGVVEIV